MKRFELKNAFYFAPSLYTEKRGGYVLQLGKKFGQRATDSGGLIIGNQLNG